MTALKQHAATIVLSLAAIAGVVVVVMDRGSVSTGEAETRKQQILPAWRRDDLVELTVTARSKTAKLTRKTATSGEWTWDVEIDGKRGPADQQFVDQYLGSLEFASWERKVSAGTDRASMKLDAPRVAVRVGMKDLSYDLVLGGEAPSPAGAAYLDVAGHATYVVTAQLAKALDVEPDSFRSRKLVPYLSTELSGLWLDGEGGARHLERAPWGGGRGAGFRFDGSGPYGKVRADADAVDRILASLGGMSAERFSDPAAGDKPKVTITLVPTSGAEKAVIEIGAPCPGDPERILAVRTAPTRVSACVGGGLLSALLTPVDQLVDKRPIGAPADEVHDVTLESGQRKIEMARAGGGWHVRGPAERDIPGDIGNGVVEAMIAVTGDAFAKGDLAELGLSPPRGKVRVVSPGAVVGPNAGGDREEVIEIGEARPARDDDNKQIVHVRRLEDGAILVLDARAAQALLPSDLSLRPRKVLDVQARSFRKLTIETPQMTQRLERPGDGGWTLLEPKGKGLESDLGLTMDVASLAGGLTAERWVADRDDGSFGLDPPRIRIEAKAEGVEAPIRIALGAPAPGGTFARAGDDPAVFVAPKSLEQAATRLLVDRRALVVDEKSIVRATLAAHDRKLVVVRDGDSARIEGFADGAPARAAALVEALAGLDAEGAVSVGAPKKEHKLDKPVLEVKIEQREGPPVELRVGAGDAWRGITVFYVRRAGIDATFAVAERRVRQLLDAM